MLDFLETDLANNQAHEDEETLRNPGIRAASVSQYLVVKLHTRQSREDYEVAEVFAPLSVMALRVQDFPKFCLEGKN